MMMIMTIPIMIVTTTHNITNNSKSNTTTTTIIIMIISSTAHQIHTVPPNCIETVTEKTSIVKAISHSSQCSTTGVTKAVVCVIPHDAYKRTLSANQKMYPTAYA